MPMATQQVQNSSGKLTWLDITKPTEEDRGAMMQLGDFTITDIEDAFQKTARSKIVKHKDYIYMVLTAPVYKDAGGTVEVQEVDLFISKKYVITVHHGTLPPLKDMMSRCTQIDTYRNDLLENGTEHLLYKIIDAIQEYTYPMVDSINDELEELKSGIFSKNKRMLVEQILQVRQNITDMRTAMRGHASVISHLMKSGKDENVLHVVKHKSQFGELIDYATELWGTLESSKEMVEALEDANDALLSHSLNDTMKMLTIVSVVLLPAGILAGLFGMNIPLPELHFWHVVGLITILSGLFLIYFARKGWLK